jgi:hypothetical protein
LAPLSFSTSFTPGATFNLFAWNFQPTKLAFTFTVNFEKIYIEKEKAKKLGKKPEKGLYEQKSH